MANSVDRDQTAPVGAVCSGSTLLGSILKLDSNVKEAKSVILNIFRKKIFFYIICKNRIKLCFHNKYVQYS